MNDKSQDSQDSTVFSDGPIKTRNEDDLGRWEFSYRIARLIAERSFEESIAIGIHAPWGEGKSSVLNLVVEALDKGQYLFKKEEKGISNGHIIKIEFNPWRFHDEEKLLHSFFAALSNSLEQSLETRKSRFGRFIARYHKAAAILDAFKINLSGGKEEVSVQPNIAGTLREYGELLIDEDVESLKRKISELLVSDGRKILIIMDDIDRLTVKELRSIFRLIKLTADFKNTIYLLAFDEKKVAKALSKQYGDDKTSGRNFLEKILQVSVPLPPADKQALFDLTTDGIYSVWKASAAEITDDQKERFSELFSKAFRSRITSPRLAKKFLNSLIFIFPLLEGEADLLDALFIEAIKVFYPGIYDAIRDNGDLLLDFTHSEERIVANNDADNTLSQAFVKVFDEIQVYQQAGIKALIQDLFPGLSRLGSIGSPTTVRPRANLVKEKRASTREYFWKYFAYGPSPYDVSDREVADFLANIETKPIDFVSKFVLKSLEKRSSRFTVLVNKLRQFEDELNEPTSERLALGISQISDKFPDVHPDDKSLGVGIRSDVCRLIMHLSSRLGSQRSDLLLTIASETPSVVFAYDFAIMVQAFGEKLEGKGNRIAIFSTGVEREVNKVVASRIASEAKNVPLRETYPLAIQDLFVHWFENDVGSLSEHVRQSIAKKPANAIDLIASLTGRNLTGDKRYDSYLHRQMNFFLMMNVLIDPSIILTALESIYPLVRTTESSSDPAERLAIEFAKAVEDFGR